jgi:hypothetical protein
MQRCFSFLSIRHFAVWEININTKTNCVPLIRSVGGVLFIGGVFVVGDSPAVDDFPIVADIPVVEARLYCCCVPIIDVVPAVSGRCAVAGVPAAAGASPVGVIPTAGSVVDPHRFQCGSGSSMLDHSDSDSVPDLGPDPAFGCEKGLNS